MNGIRQYRSLLLLSLLGAASGAADAMEQTPCEDPTVFSGAKVQVFIFPYESERALTPQARALATLMVRHVLFAALKYPSIGVAELTESGSYCRYEPVAKQVRSRLQPGQTAIFLYGQVFEQGGNVYLKSSVSVASDAGNEQLRWSLAPPATATATTTTPAEITGFAPRTIPLNYLQRLESSQALARRVHSQPDELSSYVDLPTDQSATFTFLVLEARDDWMRIRLASPRVEGWVPAHALATGQGLKGEFPELYFVDGLVGYHSLSTTAARSDRLIEHARASFERYLQVTHSQAESDPRAFALLLMGNARLRASGGEWSTGTLQAAQKDYQNAVDASPSWTPGQSHLLACSALLCARGVCGGGAAKLETQYLDAIGRDPVNRDLIDGLSAYYEAVTLGRLTSVRSAASLAKQRDAVRAVRARMPR
jgi:hypothetical protein